MTDIAYSSTRTARPRQYGVVGSCAGQSFTGIRRSFGTDAAVRPGGTNSGRYICYGDRIHVRLDRVQPGGRTLAEFTLTEVRDMSEIYGELRHYTRGLRGLTTLRVRNVTRGWTMSQPFMLYDDAIRRPAKSITGTGTLSQPSASARSSAGESQSRGRIPESIRLLYGDHGCPSGRATLPG